MSRPQGRVIACLFWLLWRQLTVLWHNLTLYLLILCTILLYILLICMILYYCFSMYFPLRFIVASTSSYSHRPKPIIHGPLVRYIKLRFAHAPGMPEMFSPPLRVSDSDMHHSTCVMHVPWCIPGSLTSSFLWSQWGKRSRHSRPMHNPQFYLSGKRPMDIILILYVLKF